MNTQRNSSLFWPRYRVESPLIESDQSLKHNKCILSQILQGKRTGHQDCSEKGDWLLKLHLFDLRWLNSHLSPVSRSEGLRLSYLYSLRKWRKRVSPPFSAQLCDLCGYSQGKPVAPIVLSPTRRAGSLMFHLNSTEESKNWTLQYFKRITQGVLTAKRRSRRIYSWFPNLWGPKQEEYTPRQI